MKIRKYQKSIAVFLLLNFLNYLFLPTVIYAGGVTADEYDSFMPAGTTDMVNTMTGDFHYDVPLFDVPSPEGSYPIHLFYEGGIKNDKNATWTGLGWNLNVGAITREVNDIPDDYHGCPYTFSESMNPGFTATSDSNYAAAIAMGSSISDQKAGNALYMPFHPSSTTLYQYGALNANSASVSQSSGSYSTTTAFDSHALNSEDEAYNGYTPEMVNGGSLPSYDQYNVTGEGLSGQIEPLILENGTLFRSSVPSSLPAPYQAIRSYPILKNFTEPKQCFRFKGEFSNSFVANANAFALNGYGQLTLNFGSNNLAYNYTLQDAIGFNSSQNSLAGGKHVDYFTNSEITNGTAKSFGFLEYPYYLDNGGYGSTSPISERIQVTYSGVIYTVINRVGGYSIMTEEGMTYHYALPVYTYGNTTTKKIATTSGVYASRTETDQNAYAYSWLLTTVTGPDYIDKNNNGYADEGDIGRWTNFNYGKATSNYANINPYSTTTGAAYHEYSNSMQLSETGSMELYFLDAV
ncbi:MAG TPA: hypothetical protein VNW06_02510, partial [Cytophagaceae bacterium]|nr:hypothetical protein [Cytophagaceae bacterium]